MKQAYHQPKVAEADTILAWRSSGTEEYKDGARRAGPYTDSRSRRWKPVNRGASQGQRQKALDLILLWQTYPTGGIARSGRDKNTCLESNTPEFCS